MPTILKKGESTGGAASPGAGGGEPAAAAPSPLLVKPAAAAGGLLTTTPAASTLSGLTTGLTAGAAGAALSHTTIGPAGHTSPELAGSDFIILEKPRRQANVLIFGPPGVGKTSFITRFCPDPIALLCFDRRAEEAAYAAVQSGRRVYFVDVSFPMSATRADDATAKKLGQAALDKVIRNFEWAIEMSLQGKVRTIGFDTATELGDLLSLAVRGRVDKGKGDYGKSDGVINRQLAYFATRARQGSAHLVMLARAKAVWANNEPTGEFTFRANEIIHEGVDWAGHMRVVKAGAGGGGLKVVGAAPAAKQPVKFELKITKAGNNIEELGEVYTSDDWAQYGPFVYSCCMQYPGSTTEEWE